MITIIEPVVIEQIIEAPVITWRDNPNACDETIHYIAEEAPFYCIDKPIAITTPIAPSSTNTPHTAQDKPQTIKNGSQGNLIGRYGSVKHYGNCVNTARAYGKIQSGNPSSWKVSTRKPFIGAAALFKYNHVSIVVGIWDNGDIEVVHENFSGSRTRFKQSEMRGYF